MKNLFLKMLVASCICHWTTAQIEDRAVNKILQYCILESEETKQWQKAMIAYQRNAILLCEVKKKQPILVTSHYSSRNSFGEKHVLELFRRIRRAGELKEFVALKERSLRAQYPQIALFVKDDFFTELYHPIAKARIELLQELGDLPLPK